MGIEEVASEVVDAAIKVHREMGPGLLEGVYEACLEYELRTRGVPVLRQVGLPVVYSGVTLDQGYRVDLLADQQVVLEVKSTQIITVLHEAQLLNYLKLGSFKLGFLLNFNVKLMKDGIKRMVNRL
ncbi:GxxExxY protein [Sedimenticola selenatireducens]|uniref:GxxExxY protein n=1 Tax=Sedimenticola selenatireducens TaxID=191960 RepID=UPI000491151C|nr:GxxExxY protein [Sedimenticola selenatireducens]